MEIGLFLINTVGFYYCLTGKINIISLVTFNTLLTFFTTPFKKFIDGLPKYNFLKASIDKLNEFLSVDEEQFGKLERINNYMIEFNNLKYSYNKINYLIKDLNIKIKENEFISLDGPSGSGKSTICNILEKYLTDYEGNVLVGNINIKDISTKTIRNLISYVNQNEFLFTGTIKENITIFKNFDEEKFFQVAKICRLENIVKDKILRYETIINSEATNISGGEMQRIILARALMKDFKILILDEALSEVDINLEKDIIKDLKKFYHDKTIIYITHKKYSNLFDRTINIGVNQ